MFKFLCNLHTCINKPLFCHTTTCISYIEFEFTKLNIHQNTYIYEHILTRSESDTICNGIYWRLIHSFAYFHMVYIIIFFLDKTFFRKNNPFLSYIFFPLITFCMHDAKTIYHCRFISLMIRIIILWHSETEKGTVVIPVG